jgi:hypothetical protein
MARVIASAKRAVRLVANPVVAAILVVGLVIPILGAFEKVGRNKGGTIVARSVTLEKMPLAFASAGTTASKSSTPLVQTGPARAPVAAEVAQAAATTMAQQPGLTPIERQLAGALEEVANAKTLDVATASARKAAGLLRPPFFPDLMPPPLPVLPQPQLVLGPGASQGGIFTLLFCGLLIALSNGPFGATLQGILATLFVTIGCGTVSG